MESGARALLSDRIEGPKPHFPLRLDDGTSTSSSSMLPDRGKSPLTLALDVTNTQLNSVTESFKSHFPHGSEGTKSLLLQGLEGTMALLAARGVEGSKGLYPLTMDGLRPYLPYGGGECVKSYLQERLDKPHKSVRDRKDSKCNMGERTGTPVSGDIKRLHHHHHHHHHERSREHKSHSVKRPTSPKSQLTNPRHDAHLTLAIRELHDEEFGLDAVLLAEGGHVGAHCAVLAAASPFLKTILLHANDHPAIISVTGTSLTTLQSLVACLYTGNIPTGANLFYLIEAAKLLRMDELAAVLQKTFFAQGSPSDMPSRSQHLQSSSQRSAVTTTTSTQLGLIPAQEHQPEKFGKKVRSNRLDQILYQKLNVNHLAPSDIPEPSLVPTSQEPSRVPPLLDSSRVPILDSPRVPPPDLHGGILGELLTKADPLRSIFSNPSIYSVPELAFDTTRTSALKPLNLSKSSKCEASSSASTLSSSSTSTTTSNLTSTATSCSISSSLTSSLASQTDHSLVGLTSLAPTLHGSIPGLLAPLTPANLSSMLSPSALASLTSSTALASLGAQHSAITSSKNKCSSGSGSSRSRSSSKSGGSGRSSSNSRLSDNHGISSHNIPLLYTLKGGMATPEMAKEVYEQLKINPQLSSLAGFTSVPNLSSLSSSASLQSLASLHNLTSLQSFPSLFPFLTSAADPSHMGSMDGNVSMMSDKVVQPSPAEPQPGEYNLGINPAAVMASNISSSVVAADDGVLNLSSSAQTVRSESPTVTTSATVTAAATGTSEEPTMSQNTSDNVDQSSASNAPCIAVDEETRDLAPTSVANNVSTGCQTVAAAIEPSDNASTVVVASSSEVNCTTSNGCSASDDATPSLLATQLDTSSLPLLLMTSGGNLGNLTQSQANVVGNLESAADLQGVLPKDSSEGVDTGDDTSSIEVVDEIPGISQTQLQNRNKALFHAGHMGRKRKGCGDCEGCQVLEDCGQCRFCRDKAKFGGPNRLKQVCVYKRCVHAEVEPEESKKKRKSSGKKGRGKCGGCDGCQRTADCNECYACLHNAAAQPPARRKVCEMRVCEQQQMEEVRATLSVAGEPSPYSTDSLMAEGIHINSGASSPTPDGQPSTHNDKMKLMRKMLKKKFAQPYSRVSPSKVRTKYYCGECPGCQTTTPCGNCLYCEDMPKFGGPGRYRQKCVKQLCVYHPRLQALKLSNRTKITYDEQHVAPETLNHLGNIIPSGPEEPVVMGCEISPERKEELEHLRAVEIVEADVTEGEDSNTAIQVDSVVERPSMEKQESVTDAEMPVVDNFSSSDTSKLSTSVANVGLHLTSAVLTGPVEHSGFPLASNSLDSVSHTSSPTPECAPTPEPVYESCTTSVDSATTSSISTIPASSASAIPTPILVPVANVPTPPPTIMESSTSIETKEENSPSLAPAEEDDDDEDDDVDDEAEAEEDEEVVSENSDVPSPPSTPSPPPRVRGRGRSRGRGRPHIKSTRHVSTLGKKGVQGMRRGRRRRTTRFNLDPDDNSDFEDQLVMSELHDENSSEELLREDKVEEKVQNDNGLSDTTHDETSSGPTSLDALDQNQSYSSTPLLGRSNKPIEPDVFEFHDSQENVLTNSHETAYSLKHNSPFVFRDEESNQGGRDVNENLGSVGETASA